MKKGKTHRNLSNIVLIGFMGTGKTVVGRRLAQALDRDFIDVDEVVERDAGLTIREIFTRFGEAHFRKLEKDTIRKVSAADNKVIAVGGGAVMDPQNIRNLGEKGLVFCLKASPEVIWERTKKTRARPLLEVDDPMGEILKLLKFRQSYYAQADYVLDTTHLNIDEVVSKIKELWEEKSGRNPG